MMKTLFLHPPSFDGFDGGAGSRYQARREIRSFWYPTWLAQPAALVPGSRLVDAPPARLKLAGCPAARRRLRAGGIAHLDPVLRLRRQGRPGAEGREPAAQDRHGRRQGRGRARGQPEGLGGARLRRPRGIRFHDQGGGRGPRLRGDRRAELAQRQRRGQLTTATARSSKTWTSCPSSARSTSAILRSKIISSAICSTLICRSTPGAAAARNAPSACGRRPSAGIATGCAGSLTSSRRSGSPGAGFRRSRNSFSTTTPLPTTARAPRRSPANWAGSASPGRATPRPTCRARRSKSCATTACACCSSATSWATSRSSTTSKRACGSTSPGASPRIATSSGSRSTAPSSWGCPAKSKETIEETIRFAGEINPHTIQVSLAAPYPGTELYRQAVENGWLDVGHAELIDERGVQIAPAALSASVAYRDLPVARNLLQALLLPPQKDRRAGRRNAQEPADAAPPAARRRRVLSFPAPSGNGRLSGKRRSPNRPQLATHRSPAATI